MANGDNGNGNSVRINRVTLSVTVAAVLAFIGWGSALYNGHEKRIRALEVSVAVTEQNTKTIMEQSDDITIELRGLRDEIRGSSARKDTK